MIAVGFVVGRVVGCGDVAGVHSGGWWSSNTVGGGGGRWWW